MGIEIDSSYGLIDAFSIGDGDVVSLVGAGGKTTTLYGIASELRRHGKSVITTTTTNMQTPRYATTMPPLVYASNEDDWLQTVRARVDRYGSATVVGTQERKDKLRGLEPDQIRLLRELANCVVLEADGARGRSLKAPASYEPVIPEVTTLTVVVAGIDALGMPLDDNIVHRLERVCEIIRAQPGTPITEEMFATALVIGYLDKIPSHSRSIFFLNKADDSRLSLAESLGRALIAAGASMVVFGEARNPHDCFYRMAS